MFKLTAKKGYWDACFTFKKMADLTAFVEVALEAYKPTGEKNERDLTFVIGVEAEESAESEV